MGDRTSVTLTVLRSQAAKAQELFSEDYASDEDVSGDLLLYSWEFEDVNYGELQFLDLLEAAGIAYDSDWSNGSEYESGCASCRFTPEGKAIEKHLYGDNDNLPLYVLKQLMDDPVALRQRIVDLIEEHTVLSWDDQETYGARYRMRQLLIV